MPLSDACNVAVHDAILSAVEDYAARNPTSQTLHTRARSHMPGGNTRSALYWAPFPLYVSRSSGYRVTDADDHDYLDVLGEYSAGLYGHSEPVIREAIARAVERGFSNGAPGEDEIRLADLVCERFPSVQSVRFCNSGTEANLYAMTLARCATGRSKVLVFSGAYHGGVFVFARGGSPMNVPYEWIVGSFNDSAGARSLMAQQGKELAAVIVEPMMSNGGCLPAEPEFLQTLRTGCTQVGAVLIFDEIVTARMGAGGLQGLLRVKPDMTTFGKFLGGGFSSGAFGGRAELMNLMSPERPDALPHAGTFNNNVYSMHVGFSALDSVFTPERAQRLYEDGEALRGRLSAMAAKICPAIRFTGCGSIMSIHFCRRSIGRPEDLADEPVQLKRLFHLDLLERGVYAAARGQINLSLPMGKPEFDSIASAVEAALAQRASLIRAIFAE